MEYENIFNKTTTNNLESILGLSLTQKLSAHCCHIQDLSSVRDSSEMKARLNLTLEESAKIDALLNIYACFECSDAENHNIFIDKLYKLAKPLGHILKQEPERETVACAYLGEENKLLHVIKIKDGSRHFVEFELKKIFTQAMRLGAKSVILAHNHTGFSFEPSLDDILTTRQAIDIGEFLGIPVTDHVIMCPAEEEHGCWHFRSLKSLGTWPKYSENIITNE